MGMTQQGDAIRGLREELGLTLRELAAAAGVSFSYLAEVERGEKDPHARWLKAVNDALADRMNQGGAS